MPTLAPPPVAAPARPLAAPRLAPAPAPVATTPAATRRHDLDWLRVIAITLLVFFHSAMPFVSEWGWHLKNAETSDLLLEVNWFLSRWRMALLFLVSGVGTAYALSRRDAVTFLRERAKRLLLPLAFGIVVVVPPQIYAERVATGATTASYLAWWPSIFTTGAYPSGNLSYHHLWFVFYLALYTVALLPFLLALRGERRVRVVARLDRLAGRVGLAAFALPLALALALLVPHFPGPQDVVHDLAMLTYYGVFFVYGYVLADAEPLWRRIVDGRARSLRLALGLLLVLNAVRWTGHSPAADHSPAWLAWGALLALHAWCWVLTVLGYARVHLNRPTRALAYLNEGIYPVYILHQTVIVVLAYFVLQTTDGLWAKFGFLSLVSLALTWGIYEAFVRPFRLVRPLFGLRGVAARARR